MRSTGFRRATATRADTKAPLQGHNQQPPQHNNSHGDQQLCLQLCVFEGTRRKPRKHEHHSLQTKPRLHRACISLEETERVLPLTDSAATARRPARAFWRQNFPKADGERGGVCVEELLAFADIPQGEETHVLRLRLFLAGDHLSGREACG